MADKSEPQPKREQPQRKKWLPEKGPYGRRWHPDLCGSGGAVERSPFLDELDRDDG